MGDVTGVDHRAGTGLDTTTRVPGQRDAGIVGDGVVGWGEGEERVVREGGRVFGRPDGTGAKGGSGSLPKG